MATRWRSSARKRQSYPSDTPTSWLTKSKDCAAAETTFSRPPPFEWIKDRLANFQQILEQRTARSAQTLRGLLGPIHLEIVTRDIGRPFYGATHDRRRARPHRRTAPRWCGGRFEFFVKWRRRVQEARKPLLTARFSVGAATAVRTLVGEREAQAVARPVLRRMTVERLHEPAAVGVAELNGDIGGCEAALEI